VRTKPEAILEQRPHDLRHAQRIIGRRVEQLPEVLRLTAATSNVNGGPACGFGAAGCVCASSAIAIARA
jgi:hypothetical protein